MNEEFASWLLMGNTYKGLRDSVKSGFILTDFNRVKNFGICKRAVKNGYLTVKRIRKGLLNQNHYEFTEVSKEFLMSIIEL